MKKITFVSYYPFHGGSLRKISVLANRFAEKNYEVNIVFVSQEYGEFYDLNENIKVKALLKSTKTTSFFRNVPALAKAVSKLDSDVYVSFLISTNIYLLIANIFLKKKIVIAEQTDPRYYKTHFIWVLLKKILYPFAPGAVFQTEAQREYYGKRLYKKSIVIPNPINPNLPDACTGVRTNRIVAVGRLSYEKNYPLLIKAFAKVHKSLPEYTLHIYGKGPELSALRMLIKRLGLVGKVILEGFRKDVYEKISDAALYVISSDFEGMSNALIEGMGMGLPVISTTPETGGVRELIEHGRNGLLVPVGDENALAKAIITVLKNDELARKLGSEAIKIRETHNVELIFRNWEKYLYGISRQKQKKR